MSTFNIWDPAGDEATSALKLNGGAMWKASDLAALAGTDDSGFIGGLLIMAFVPNWGLYLWRPGQDLAGDGEFIVNTASNQFELQCPHGDAIFAYLEPRLADLQTRLEALE